MREHLCRLLFIAHQYAEGYARLFRLRPESYHAGDARTYHGVGVHQKRHARNRHQRTLEAIKGKSTPQTTPHNGCLSVDGIQLLFGLSRYRHDIALVGIELNQEF